MTIEPLTVPLRLDEEGTIRLKDSRLTLDVILEAYQEGASPVTIAGWFDSLTLADVYAILGFYLSNKEQVDEYLHRREQEAEEIRRQIEASQPPRPGFREVLLARKAQLEKKNASPGQ